eukprot:gb/GFBE01015780.1/.p1 GENE.gb/GFBE01015780.1/~~gb/GFBE01015780.1/.p1  ORF type:complete len:202 (+),score=50.59 gb/GFBE01015780.1/:1-606(+)
MAKSAAEGAAEGERDPKKAKTKEEQETLAKMLVRGVVRVLQNRNSEGKGPLKISEIAAEFKALWKVPFNLQQAGESDVITLLHKYPSKMEIFQEGGDSYVHLPKKAVEKAKAAGKAAPPPSKAPAARPTASKTPPPAPSSSAPVDGQAPAVNKDVLPAAAPTASRNTLLQLKEEAGNMLESMREMLQAQELFVKTLGADPR